MRPCDLDTGAAHLRDALDDLQIAWQETSQQWSDGVSQAFCELYLDPVGRSVKIALDEVSRMQQLMNQIHRDCEQ